jgi:hypothetical protein
MKNLSFKALWSNYPLYNGEDLPCKNSETNDPNFENQCAIRMGVALEKSGFDLSSYHGVRCWSGLKCSGRHLLRVEELAVFLEARLGKPRKYHHITYDEFPDKQGIVAFYDFWARREGGALTGDHFDLFNGTELKNGELDYFERSRKVLFWEIND